MNKRVVLLANDTTYTYNLRLALIKELINQKYEIYIVAEILKFKEELESICKQTLCMEFINEMPDGFETDLGATGKAVSGGQKQRLALARALLRNPQILLLDEATSALDSENQEKFLHALNEWRKSHPCTVITVAHRLSTIVESDIIFVINEGQLIASGKHEELIDKKGHYFNMVNRQNELENIRAVI